MGLINWLTGITSKEVSEKREFGFEDNWYYTDTNSITATPNSAVGIPAVFSAVNIVSSNIAKLDMNVWKVNSKGEKTIDRKHSVAKLLKLRPNQYMSSFDFKRTMVSNYLLWGNAYVWLSSYDAKGNVSEITLLSPNATTVEKDVETGKIFYRSTHPLTNKPLVLQPYEVIHLKHFSSDGLIGKSPISIVNESLSQKLGMIKHSKKLYENGTSTSHVLKSEEFMDKTSKENLRVAWEKANSGVGNSGRVAILDGGLDLQNITMPMRDAQFIETMQFGIREIASIFNVPPHMLADNSGLKYSNISQQAMSFLQECLQPILIMIQQEFLYKLMTPSEQMKYELCFDTTEMIKATDIERAEYYEKMVGSSILTIDEARELEGYNPLPKEEQPQQVTQPDAKEGEVQVDESGSKTEPSEY